MSTTLKQKDIWDYIADLSQRVNRLETGGKPIVGLSDPANVSLSADANEIFTNITSTLTWVDTDVNTNPGAVPYFALFIDEDNDPTHIWPSGSGLTAEERLIEVRWFMDLAYLSNNPNQNRVRYVLWNTDSIAHTLHFYTGWTYVKGGSGSA